MSHLGCCATDYSECKAFEKNYVFSWHDHQSINVLLCTKHYRDICDNNGGYPPILYGASEDEAINYLLSYLDNQVSWSLSECQGKCYGNCNGKLETYFVPWQFVQRSNYDNIRYYTTLPMTFCENHFNEILHQNRGNFPHACGRDDWDALDSITLFLDSPPTYKSLENEITMLATIIEE